MATLAVFESEVQTLPVSVPMAMCAHIERIHDRFSTPADFLGLLSEPNNMGLVEHIFYCEACQNLRLISERNVITRLAELLPSPSKA